MNTVLHIPLNKELKSQAESIAKANGYSSIQEVLRVFITQFTSGEIKSTFVIDHDVQLTSEQAAFLDRRVEEIEKAKKKNEVYRVSNVEEMMAVLDS